MAFFALIKWPTDNFFIQVCEVAVPESKFMGYSCSEVRYPSIETFPDTENFVLKGTFCCRQLAEPGLPDPNLLQRSVDK